LPRPRDISRDSSDGTRRNGGPFGQPISSKDDRNQNKPLSGRFTGAVSQFAQRASYLGQHPRRSRLHFGAVPAVARIGDHHFRLCFASSPTCRVPVTKALPPIKLNGMTYRVLRLDGGRRGERLLLRSDAVASAQRGW
jgi:hypothetical protein